MTVGRGWTKGRRVIVTKSIGSLFLPTIVYKAPAFTWGMQSRRPDIHTYCYAVGLGTWVTECYQYLLVKQNPVLTTLDK